MWQWIYDSKVGALNGLLLSLGLIGEYRGWLSQPTYVLLALAWSDSLLVVLTGVSVASWLHVLSHVLDQDIGGHPATDIPGLAALACWRRPRRWLAWP